MDGIKRRELYEYCKAIRYDTITYAILLIARLTADTVTRWLKIEHITI